MSAYARAVRLTEWSWEVFCTDCKGSIGTMSGDTLSRAIIATANKGGVKCPDCRSASCKRCGFLPGSRLTLQDDGICDFCHWEIDTKKEAKKVETFIEVTLV